MGKKSKSPTKGKRSKSKDLRDPKASKKSPRGVPFEVDLGKDLELSKEEIALTFGPCEVEAHQAKTAIILLDSPELHVVLESLNCLQKFCKKSDENKVLFIQMDGLVLVKKLIFHDNIVVQRFAMKLMAITSDFHEATIQFRDMDLGKDFAGLACSVDDVIVEYATKALSNLAALYTGRLQIIQSGAVPHFIRLLGHEDPDIQKNSAEAIWRLIEEPMNTDLITTKSSIEPILNLVDSEYPELQTVVLSILERVALRDPGVQVLDSVGAISKFGEKLARPDCGDLHRVILRTLTNMCLNPSVCAKIVPLVPAAARVLDTSPDDEARLLALGLIGILCSIHIAAQALIDYGMGKRLIKMITAPEDEYDQNMKETAAYCISQIAQTEFRAKLEFIEALRPLLTLTELKLSDAGFEYVMLAIASILEDGQKACPRFVNENGLCVLKKILDKWADYSEDGILSLLTSLTHISSHWELRPHCIQAGIVHSLVSAGRGHQNPQFVTACAAALSTLLCNEHGRKQFFEKHGYDFLVELISHTEYPVVISAVPIIHILGSHSQVAKFLIEKGILQVIWERQDLVSKNGPFRTALERLITTYLPAKYAMGGHLDPYEKIGDGFYDIGGLRAVDVFLTINQMTWEGRDPTRQVLFLNWSGECEYEIALQNNKCLQVMKESGDNCQAVVDTVKEKIADVHNEEELVRLIATVVSDHFGGVLEKWKVGVNSEEVEIVNLQVKHESVVVPISMISGGGFRTRTLLFKALCDMFGIPCSLDRGEYNRMWNVVLLQAEDDSENPKAKSEVNCPDAESEETRQNLAFTEKLRRFVVDLVYQPGDLFPVNSYDANRYCFV